MRKPAITSSADAVNSESIVPNHSTWDINFLPAIQRHAPVVAAAPLARVWPLLLRWMIGHRDGRARARQNRATANAPTSAVVHGHGYGLWSGGGAEPERP